MGKGRAVEGAVDRDVCPGVPTARIIGQSAVNALTARHRGWGALVKDLDAMEQGGWIGRAGRLASVAGIGFLLLVLALQVARGDLDWIDAQLSAYLHGPYGLALRSAYCGLAAVMALLALALWRSLQPAARSVTVLGLFWGGALGLSAVAVGDSWLPELAPAIALPVHLLSAQAAFLCVIAAVLLQSWYFRRDPAWRDHHRSAFVLGLGAFVVLAVHVGVAAAPRGLSQKLAIALIVLWLVRVGAWLARHAAAGAARTPASRNNARIIQHEEA
jgi:hypothetical protein